MQLVEAIIDAPDSALFLGPLELTKPVVLVLEHVARDAEQIFRGLAEAGFYPLITPSATRGLELARLLRPNLVLVNQGLPDVSGFRVVQQLVKSPATADVPVVLVGRADDPGTRVWTQRAGAVDYLSKEEELSAGLVETVARRLRPVLPTDDGARILDGEQLAVLRDIMAEIQDDRFLTESGKAAVVAAEAAALIGLGHCRGAVLDEQAHVIVDDHEWLVSASGVIVDPSVARLSARIPTWPGYRDIAVVLPAMPLYVQYVRHA